MKKGLRLLIKISDSLGLTMAAIAFSIALILSFLFTTLLTPQYHEKLLDQYSILPWMKQSFVMMFEKQSDYTLQDPLHAASTKEPTIALLESLLTSDQFEMDARQLINGLFDYISGTTPSLPDIPIQSKSWLPDGVALFSAGLLSPEAKQSLLQLENINLGTILLFLDREDITDTLSLARLIYRLGHMLQFVLLFGSLSTLLIRCLYSKSFKLALRYFYRFLIVSSMVLVLFGALLFLLQHALIPTLSARLLPSLLPSLSLLNTYIDRCIIPLAVRSIAIGLLTLLTVLILPLLIRYKTQSPQPHLNKKRIPLQMTLSRILIVLILGSFFFMNYLHLMSHFKQQGYDTLLSKLLLKNKVSSVIFAQNDTLYGLRLHLYNTQNQAPIEGVWIQLTPIVSKNTSPPREYILTDQTGTAMFSLTKGSYKISFSYALEADGYKMPDPLTVEVKTPGMTPITLGLEPLNE